ncbi:MAG: hypothetical protein JWO46_2172, partial [Nocardioidaceae bacterium]|nr:hypothetical protein [Nocardioidaceae bacterium]
MAHHEWRPDWTLDRTCLYWYMTFDMDTALIERAEQLGPALTRLHWVNRVPTDWLHLTLQEVGYVDDVTPEEVSQIAEAARQVQDLLPLNVELGAVTTMTDAVVLPAVLSPELVQAHALLADSIGDRAHARPDAEPFW